MSKRNTDRVPLRVVTSFFVPQAAAALPQPVVDALRSHAGNSLVREVHILTESDTTLVSRLVSQVVSSKKFSVVRCEKRPPFSVLFSHAAQLFQQDPAPVAIMNADVSFAGTDDISRANEALRCVAKRFGKAVMALTRHDKVDGEWRLTLRQSDGLPNTLSADCWILSGPIDLAEADFYCLGHMNCDLMLAYDLVATGYQIFNPCLDVRILHHETNEKDATFYALANDEEETHERFLQHTFVRCNEPFVAYGFNWLRTDWILAGSLPSAISSRRKKLYIVLPDDDLRDVLHELMSLEVFASQQEYDMVLISEDPSDGSFQTLRPIWSASRSVYLQTVADSVDDFLKAILGGGLEGAQSVGFCSNSAFCREEISKELEAMVLDLRGRKRAGVHGRPVTTGEDANYWLQRRYGVPLESCGLKARESACTLVTSLFKSGTYLDKFLSNSATIYAYDEKVDHLFFVSDLSNREAASLLEHLRGHPNSLVVWHRRDPGLYACWNQGLRMACTWYVSNANVDDLRDPLQLWKLIDTLETRADICVAASALVPFQDHARAEVSALDKSRPWYADQAGEFSYEHLARVSDGEGGVKHLDPHNLPHCMPVWRRSLHDEHGYFDETRYGTFADWAFWLHVFRRGGKGYLVPEPLSFYYINPASHNRRGEKLAEWHHRIELEHLESFCLRLDGRQVVGRQSKRPSWQKKESAEGDTIRKLDLHGRHYAYGEHRNSFNTIIDHLEPLHRGDDGVLLLPFVERYFVWGNEDGEASSARPRPLDRDWIGILHSPFDAPPWFEPKISPENIFRTPLWEQSFHRCRGLITLSKDLEEDLKWKYPDLPTHSLLHPTSSEAKRFNMEAYLARPRVIQAGDWLRKLQAIYQLNAPEHQKVMLFKLWTRAFLEREIEAVGDFRNSSVEERDFITNEEYDDLLSSSVVLCLLYASAANNLVLECLVRHTPIIINPLPSVVEYLGPEYPLYARDIYEAEERLSNPDVICNAVQYLGQRRMSVDLSYKQFTKSIAYSSLYETLVRI